MILCSNYHFCSFAIKECLVIKCVLLDLFISFSQDDGQITISDSDSEEERVSYQSEPVRSQAARNTGSFSFKRMCSDRCVFTPARPSLKRNLGHCY